MLGCLLSRRKKCALPSFSVHFFNTLVPPIGLDVTRGFPQGLSATGSDGWKLGKKRALADWVIRVGVDYPQLKKCATYSSRDKVISDHIGSAGASV